MKKSANSGLYSQDFTFSSLTKDALNFVCEIVDINDQELDNNTFMLSQTFGVLNGFDTVQIRVFYSPDKVGV